MLVFTVFLVVVLICRGSSQQVSPDEGDTIYRNDSTGESSLSCPSVWSIPVERNNSMACECGSNLFGLIHCDKRTLQVEIRACYCITLYAKDPTKTVIGPCMFKCRHANLQLFVKSIPGDKSELSDYMCNITVPHSDEIQSLNRDGQLCGTCKEGFAPPAYSYDWRCVNCSLDDASWKRNWAKYFAIAYLPLTVCFIVIVIFRININSPLLNAFVFISQVVASPMAVKAFTSNMKTSSVSQLNQIQTVISLYGFWNLDFFRVLCPLFCLHPNMSTLQVLALDYGIAVYPLFLIVVTYALVELHDRNCRIVVSLWKPFHRCFVCFRRQWNIRASLIDAFVSFLVLSYMKFLIVSFYFLIPVRLYKVDAQPIKESYLFFDATIEYFGQHHLPYAILAIVVLSLFNIFPILLLCFYPCSWFQKFLNCCRLSHHALHMFMDAFQGCYKNGTDGMRDCRWFSGVYFIVRIAVFLVASTAPSELFAIFVGMLLLLPIALVAVVQPYKVPFYNGVDTVLILTVALFSFSAIVDFIKRDNMIFNLYPPVHLVTFMLCIFGITPLIYITIVILYHVFLKHVIPHPWLSIVWRLLQCQKQSTRREEVLPERLTNPEECAALLQEPISHGHGTRYGSTAAICITSDVQAVNM